MWNNIVNPKTGRKVDLNSKLGRDILNKFIKQLGGVRFKNKEEERQFNEFKKKLRVMEQEKRVRRLEDKFIKPIKNKKSKKLTNNKRSKKMTKSKRHELQEAEKQRKLRILAERFKPVVELDEEFPPDFLTTVSKYILKNMNNNVHYADNMEEADERDILTSKKILSDYPGKLDIFKSSAFIEYVNHNIELLEDKLDEDIQEIAFPDVQLGQSMNLNRDISNDEEIELLGMNDDRILDRFTEHIPTIHTGVLEDSEPLDDSGLMVDFPIFN